MNRVYYNITHVVETIVEVSQSVDKFKSMTKDIERGKENEILDSKYR